MSDDREMRERAVEIPTEGPTLPGALRAAEACVGVVIFAHGSGSSRFSPRNRFVASALEEAGLGTLLLDLLTEEEASDRRRVFDIPLLARRLSAAVRFVEEAPENLGTPGLFGASTGAGAALAKAQAPTLLIVGGADEMVLDLNRRALEALRCEKSLEVVPGATHLFEEEGALERVADLARSWFTTKLSARGGSTGGSA